MWGTERERERERGRLQKELRENFALYKKKVIESYLNGLQLFKERRVVWRPKEERPGGMRCKV